MKHLSILLILFALLAIPMHAQAQSSYNDEEVVKIDRANMQAARPGEVIVKFKESGAVNINAPRRAKFASSQVSAVDQLFMSLGVDSVEELMPLSGKKPLPRRIKAYNGKDIEPSNLGKLYRIKLTEESMQEHSVYRVIEELKSLSEVEYAEPNYLVYAMSAGDAATYQAEPLYSQQWGPAAINLPYLWEQPKVTTKRPVIAILDTGVDFKHPDLEANIWTNTREENGLINQDDDQNGFTDDVHGWDFINQTSDIHDWNGHGTHCAGIAAAVGNNGIGITGANPDALIMPIVVLQSDGVGDVATIIRGIDYAAANGADVLSMSFGTYSYAIALEQALGRAYATAVLVAAAGNDHKSVDKTIPCREHGGAPMFPAAFTFVLGVEASSQDGLASFSNYDPSGAIYSTYGEEQLYNYELRAPGTNIMSTFPNGRYKAMNGTSMACPLVAGAISRLLQLKTDSSIVSKEVLFGDLIHSRSGSAGNINMQTVYNFSDATRTPTLALINLTVNDSLGDNDGRYDAGETIALYPTFRNHWGLANNIRYWIRLGYYDDDDDWVDDDASLITIHTDTVEFGQPLSSYAKAKSANPLLFSISPNCADGRHINMTVFAVCDNIADTLKQTVSIEVENCIEIGGLILTDMFLTPNNSYKVTSHIGIPEGVTLTIQPGTIVDFQTYQIIQNNGRLICQGTPDSIIVLTGRNWEGVRQVKSDTITYTRFEYLRPTYSCAYRDCEFYYNEYPYVFSNSYLENCNIYYGNKTYSTILSSSGSINGYKTEYINSNIISNSKGNISMPTIDIEYYMMDDVNIFNNDLFRGTFVSKLTTQVIDPVKTPYFGTTNIQKVENYVATLYANQLNLENLAQRPYSGAHGVVWKVVIDGYDAQEELDQLPPLGVGTHTCQVYFNRAMDTIVTPYVSYGVRPPYTQHTISGGTWSADSTIYTANFTITGTTVSDGLNRIYVADAEDNEHFKIPYENLRFNMEIAAAGSMSTGLMATPGLGKVTLDWETDEEDFEDLLGYNIYRWTNDTIRLDRHWDSSLGQYVEAGWRIDTVKVNNSLIDAQDQQFVDFDVTPGKTYYYIIRQQTTSLNSYDLSNTVAATPLTAVRGDANGSMSVDVADVVTEILYLTDQNPQPFIFEAADVNSDNTINVLDVVGTIRIITNPGSQSQSLDEGSAFYEVVDGVLYVDADVVLGGVQFTIEGDQESTTIRALSDLDEFEKLGQWTSESSYMFMAYSMSGKTLGIGRHALLEIGDAELQSIVLSDTQGHNVTVYPIATRLEDGTISRPGVRKILENNQIYLLYGDKKFTIMGQSVE